MVKSTVIAIIILVTQIEACSDAFYFIGTLHTNCPVFTLLKNMYGLPDAPEIWQEVVRTMFLERGFKPLVGIQCCYIHHISSMVIVAHVDDFLVLAEKNELREFLSSLQGEFECTGDMFGNEPGDASVLKFLGRTITLTNDGIEWEGDKKHVQQFLQKLGDEFGGGDGSKELRGVRGPGHLI